jgi:hypothetical protein
MLSLLGIVQQEKKQSISKAQHLRLKPMRNASLNISPLLEDSIGLKGIAPNANSAIFPASATASLGPFLERASLRHCIRTSISFMIENSPQPQEPTDEDIRYFADLCQCIGFVVVHWSLTEQQLDNWVNVCFNNCGGSKFQNGSGVPRSLKPKLAFLRMCLKTLPALAEFRTEGVALLSRVSLASKRRHDLIHGAITELRPDPATGAFRFRRIGYDGNLHTLSEFTITPDDFRAFAPVLTDLVTDTIAFSQRLGDRFLGS